MSSPKSNASSKKNAPPSGGRPGYSVRPATVDDLDPVAAIEKAVYPEAAAPWTREHFASELEKPYSHFWVVTDDETDEEIAAYLVFWVLGDDCRILNIAIAPGHRRHGFGRYLIRKAVGEALRKGVPKISLEVRKSNQIAQAFYQSLRFSIVRTHKDFYKGRTGSEDAYIFELPLQDDEGPFAGIAEFSLDDESGITPGDEFGNA